MINCLFYHADFVDMEKDEAYSRWTIYPCYFGAFLIELFSMKNEKKFFFMYWKIEFDSIKNYEGNIEMIHSIIYGFFFFIICRCHRHFCTYLFPQHSENHGNNSTFYKYILRHFDLYSYCELLHYRILRT